MINICYESTKLCNLNCEYCITSDNDPSVGDKIYEKIIKAIVKLQPQRIVVSGGEPLLDPVLIPKLSLLRMQCEDAFISLSTNGSIDYDFRHIMKFIDCIDISLPTLDRALYQEMRGKDCIEQVHKNIEQAVDLELNVRISYMLSKVNCAELPSILDYAEKAGVQSVRIGRFMPFRDSKAFRDKYELDSGKIKEIMEYASKKEYSFKIIPPIDNLNLIENGYLTINYMGDIFLPTEQGKIMLGNIEDGNLESLEERIATEQKGIFKELETKKNDYIYGILFRPYRTRESKKRIHLDEFYSDHTRIIYSSSFRRLQQKAQVFSLESNSTVRSRLSHSVEVADIGRRLATRISERLSDEFAALDQRYKLRQRDMPIFISIIENACLLHDIGNPPFGHFGEEAVKKWWKENYKKYIETYNLNAERKNETPIHFNTPELEVLLKDFEEFDGNPQGIRTVIRLHSHNDLPNEKFQSGLNLSYPTILCALKYVRAAGEANNPDCNESIVKKAGYFQSEKPIVNYIYETLDMDDHFKRFPLTYIMEAADDIAYCMSDISDGIVKKVITVQDFINEFQLYWKAKFKEDVPEGVLSNDIIKEMNSVGIEDFSTRIAFPWKTLIIDEVVENFMDNIDGYMGGKAGSIITEDNHTNGEKILTTIKQISRKIIYRSREAEEIEMAGYSVISGLLKYFGNLLTLTYDEFMCLYDNSRKKKGLDLEWRIFNRLSKRCVKSYLLQLNEWKDKYPKLGEANIEWWLRAHLIVDHISGMTDDFALKTYQVCKGINVQVF